MTNWIPRLTMTSHNFVLLINISLPIYNINNIISFCISKHLQSSQAIRSVNELLVIYFTCIAFRRRNRIKISQNERTFRAIAKSDSHYKTWVEVNWFCISGAVPSTIKFTCKINYTFKIVIRWDCLEFNKFYMRFFLFISIFFYLHH